MVRTIIRGLKSIYGFFAGDAIILAAVVLAFSSAFLLAGIAAANLLAAVIFLFLIVAGLVATLMRELLSRSR